MSTINHILIKRRLAGSPLDTIPVLSGGELAFSEKNNTLYYGGETGTLLIGGDGAYVTRTTNQTISGDKTLSGLTTLSSVTFFPDSLINIGNNVLTNVAYPSAAQDGAHKMYVDELEARIGRDFVNRTTAQDVSGSKTFFDIATFKEQVNLEKGLSVTEGVTANSYNINSDIVIDSSKNAYFANIDASGNLTVQGDLKVYGDSSIIETTVTAASAFTIESSAATPALTVRQYGPTDVAVFYDGDNVDTALIIKDGGNVGINTATPNERLTVSGNISANNNIYAFGSLEVNGGAAVTTLHVENAKVGVNTVTPNEALTVLGSISASNNVYAINGDYTGTLDIDGAVTLGSTLYVTSGSTFASTLSTLGTVDFDSSLDVVGATTLQSTLAVTGGTTFSTSISGIGTSVSLINFIVDGGSF